MKNFLNKLFSTSKYYLPLGDQIRLVAPFSGETDSFRESVFTFQVEQIKFIVLDGTIFEDSKLITRDRLISGRSRDSYRIRLMDFNNQVKIDYYPCLWDRFSPKFLRLKRGEWRVQIANNKQDLLTPLLLDISAKNLEDFPKEVYNIATTIVDQFWKSYQDAYCKFLNKKAQKFSLRVGNIDFINQLGDATNLVAPDKITRFLATCAYKSQSKIDKN